MAGVFIHFGPAQPDRLQAAAERFRFADEHEEQLAGASFSFMWSGLNDPALFGPAYDPATGVRVITAGRVSWTEAEWQRAEHLGQFEGGLSNRLLLEAYLQSGAEALERHNGPAMLVVWDPRSKRVHLFTDHFGYHPVFVYRPESVDKCVIATHADVLADDEAVHTTPDLVTMAEFLRYWRATPPHTYYTEIKYAGPATHWSWDMTSGKVHQEVYWTPYQDEPYPDIQAAAEDLASALEHAVHIRTLPRLSPTVCYASGGMDSRTILFAAADPEGMIGLNMYEVPNNEARIAKEITEAAGARYVGFARDHDYYPRWMAESARLSGAMWSTEDSHFLGTSDVVRELGARTVMTGCTADRVFKASPMETRYKTFLGKNLPLKELYPERLNAFLPNRPSGTPAPVLLKAVEDRFEARFADTPREFKDDRDWLLVEDRRIRPNCYASSVSGPIMYRIFPYDTFLADRTLADSYSRMRAEWKVNARVWGMAVARVSGKHKGISVANNGFHLDDPVALKLLKFGKGWVQRRVSNRGRIVDQGPATDGSWPRLGWYVMNSPTLRSMWEAATPEERDRVKLLWGGNPWQEPLEYWARRPNHFFRILTLLNHWEHTQGSLFPDPVSSHG